MIKQFVTYEIALKFKELGFNEECFGYYHINEGYQKGYAFCYSENSRTSDCSILAPLWQQVIDWFREKYGLEITITSWENNIIPGRSESISYILYSGANFKYNIYKYNPWHIFDSKYIFNTYHKAREQAILKAIELIITNYGNKK